MHGTGTHGAQAGGASRVPLGPRGASDRDRTGHERLADSGRARALSSHDLAGCWLLPGLGPRSPLEGARGSQPDRLARSWPAADAATAASGPTFPRLGPSARPLNRPRGHSRSSNYFSIFKQSIFYFKKIIRNFFNIIFLLLNIQIFLNYFVISKLDRFLLLFFNFEHATFIEINFSF